MQITLIIAVTIRGESDIAQEKQVRHSAVSALTLHVGQFQTAWQVGVDTEVFTTPDLTSPLVETLKLL